jgi:hypothetical protein
MGEKAGFSNPLILLVLGATVNAAAGVGVESEEVV